MNKFKNIKNFIFDCDGVLYKDLDAVFGQVSRRMTKYIAKKLDCWFVDQDKLIDKKDENFVDSIHFTPIGMKKLAQNFGDTILEIKE